MHVADLRRDCFASLWRAHPTPLESNRLESLVRAFSSEGTSCHCALYAHTDRLSSVPKSILNGRKSRSGFASPFQQVSGCAALLLLVSSHGQAIPGLQKATGVLTVSRLMVLRKPIVFKSVDFLNTQLRWVLGMLRNSISKYRSSAHFAAWSFLLSADPCR
jgi:hypothetical protein